MSYHAKPIFFLNPLNSILEIKEAMKSFLKDWLPLHSFEGELKLYHYTTLSGLTGILENRSIWCSHIGSLNDTAELLYGKELIMTQLNDLLLQKHNKHITQILEDLRMYIDIYEKHLYYTYIACFCESDNLLSQWRGYSDNKGSYDLGFSFNSNTKFCHNSNKLDKESYIILRKVIYNKVTQAQLITNYLSSIIDAANLALEQFESDDKPVPDLWSSQVAMESSNLLFDIMLSLKNEVFQEEAEWRLIKSMMKNVNPDLINFRENNGNKIPYLPTYFFDESKDRKIFPLISIRFGPTLEELITKPMLDLMIQKIALIDSGISLNANNIQIRSAGYKIR